MVECFHRNEEKNANNDVAECIFNMSEERILLTYHKENDKISASTQEFNKPPNAHEKGAYILWHSDTHTTFQVRSHSYNLPGTVALIQPSRYGRTHTTFQVRSHSYNLPGTVALIQPSRYGRTHTTFQVRSHSYHVFQ